MSKQVGDGEIQQWISYAVDSHVDSSDVPPGYDWPAPSTDAFFGSMDIPAGETVKLFCEVRAWGEAYRGEQPTPTPVPEPTTMLMLSSGLIGLVGYGSFRRRRKT